MIAAGGPAGKTSGTFSGIVTARPAPSVTAWAWARRVASAVAPSAVSSPRRSSGLRHMAHRAGVRNIVAGHLICAACEDRRAHETRQPLQRRPEIIVLAHEEIEPLPQDRLKSEPGR